MTTTKIKINELITDGLQTRVELNEEIVQRYLELYAPSTAAGDPEEAEETQVEKLPPVSVVYDPVEDRYYLVDGFHRVEAASRAGLDEIEAEVVADGDETVALGYALAANAHHGLPRTSADIAKALQIAWDNRELMFKGEPSPGLLAKTCAVGRLTVIRWMKSTCITYTSQYRIGLDGRKIDSTGLQKKDDAQEKAPPGLKRLLKEGLDRFGQAIPEAKRAAFNLSMLRTVVRMVKSTLKVVRHQLEIGNPAFAKIKQQAIQELVNAANWFDFGMAFCICPYCHGEGCFRCDQQGWLVKAQYDKLPLDDKQALEANRART